MRVITVEQDNCDVLSQITKKAFSNDEIISFTDPMLAIKYCVSNKVQMIVCEQTLKRLDGLSFIKLINQRYSDVKAVLICKDSDVIGNTDGIEIRCIKYPVTVEQLTE